MNKKIDKILSDLYQIDSSLYQRGADFRETILQLLQHKPELKAGQDFVIPLRNRLLIQAEQMEAYRLPKFNLLAYFNGNRKLAVNVISLAVILVVGSSVFMSAVGRDKPLNQRIDSWQRSLTGGGANLTQRIDDWLLGGDDNKLARHDQDDWQYNPEAKNEESFWQKAIGGMAYRAAPQAIFSESAMSDQLGLAVGGANDINNFRENIANNYLPIPTDITYEGLYYDYFFDTGNSGSCDQLFCPTYSTAVSADPFSGEKEYWLSVGLNSNIKESDFSRKKLNVVVVLDISGSMSSPFDQYYYDQFGNQVENSKGSNKAKMEIAAQSVVDLLGHLNDDDRFGMVLFESSAHLAKPLNLVGETDIEKIKDHILEVQATGGTQMSAGMKEGTDLFKELKDVDKSEYENRIIFLTDAMPNIGETNKDGLLGLTENNAADGLYSTFIGIGVDFNTELIEYITKIKGANYYSVHNADEFKTRMDDEFEYMVTPLVFGLELKLEAQGYSIEKVFGSPEASEATGQIMKVNTLFPSKTADGQTKGGLVLLKLKKISNNASLKITASYQDREGNKKTNQSSIDYASDNYHYDNLGIRKGILLSQYASLMKGWIIDERSNIEKPMYFDDYLMDKETGIMIPPDYPNLGQWERQSMSLQVSDHYQQLFSQFKTYFNSEKSAIGDNTLSQELQILNKLINY